MPRKEPEPIRIGFRPSRRDFIIGGALALLGGSAAANYLRSQEPACTTPEIPSNPIDQYLFAKNIADRLAEEKFKSQLDSVLKREKALFDRERQSWLDSIPLPPPVRNRRRQHILENVIHGSQNPVYLETSLLMRKHGINFIQGDTPQVEISIANSGQGPKPVVTFPAISVDTVLIFEDFLPALAGAVKKIDLLDPHLKNPKPRNPAEYKLQEEMIFQDRNTRSRIEGATRGHEYKAYLFQKALYRTSESIRFGDPMKNQFIRDLARYAAFALQDKTGACWQKDFVQNYQPPTPTSPPIPTARSG